MKFTLILPAKMVPMGHEVTKPTGSKPYTLLDAVRIFASKDVPESQKLIQADEGVLFLFPSENTNGVVSAISADSLVAMHFDNAAQLADFAGTLADAEDEK